MSKKDKFKYSIAFWAITLPLFPYFITLLTIAFLNPFWFRDDLLQFVHDHLHSFNVRRSKLLKPMRDKYKVFDILQARE